MGRANFAAVVKADENNTFLSEIEERTGIARRQIEDDLLRERYKSAEAIAETLGVDTAAAKRILADPDIQRNAIKVFIRSAKAELDLIEIPTLLATIKAPVDSGVTMGAKRRASERLRKILESAEKAENIKPLVQFNQQINNNFPDGTIETFIRDIDKK